MKKDVSPFESKLFKKFGPTGGAIAILAIEILQILVISLGIILPVRMWLIKPFLVQGASMEPTFIDDEYLIIDEISYRFADPGRGDVVVFHYPLDKSQRFIKRVIGLPGETVEVTSGKVIVYNDDNPVGRAIQEEYLAPGVVTQGKKRVKLNEGEYFVLGDNRDFSLDSRSFGPIKDENIIGRVWIRGFPISRFGGFEHPEYNL